MRAFRITLFAFCAGLSLSPLLAQNGTPDAACDKAGGLDFICGLGAPPEDLAALPGNRYLVASGMRAGGALKLVDTQARTARLFYTGAAAQIAPDRTAFPDCRQAPDPDKLSTHGISLRRIGNARAILYAVGHGELEAIQVFEISTRTPVPAITWIGCVPLPEGQVANAVASFSDGTILATVLTRPGTSARDFLEGRPTGVVLSWSPGEKGFRPLPGTELPGNNGIETDANGDRFYVSATGLRLIVEFSRRDPSRPLRTFKTPGFIPDNLHWRGGRLLAAGMRDDEAACGGIWRVVDGRASLDCPRGYIAAELDPASAQWRVLAEGEANAAFRGVATALVAGRTLWLGSFLADRLGFRPLPIAAR